MTDSAHSETSFAYQHSIVINYEDTDAGGVVYYGNYLGYMERARNAYLRELGYPLSALQQDSQVLFVVTDVRLKYLVPARLDDELLVTLDITNMTAASILFHHKVMRESEILVEGEIMLAVLDTGSFKPKRIPDFLRNKFSNS